MDKDFYSPKNLLSRILGEILENMPLEQRAGKEMVRGWEGIVGRALSEKSRVADLQKECLHIAVREGGSKQLILMKKYDILKKVNKQYPGLTIKDIHVFIDKSPQRSIISERPEQTERTDEEKKTKKEITDKEFKLMMQRIKSYGRQKE